MARYYGPGLAAIHHEAFGGYAEMCAPGILASLDPGCRVLELGAGSGALTRHLIAAGHRVIATDASVDMLEILAEAVPQATKRVLELGIDEIPAASTIVSVGHALNYLDSVAVVLDVIEQCARALEPGGLLLMDLLDLSYGAARADLEPIRWEGEGWVMDVSFSLPAPDRFVRDISIERTSAQGEKVVEHERHVNVLLDASRAIEALSAVGIDADLQPSFGEEELPGGFVVLRGSRLEA